MYHIITIEREYASGGNEIGRQLAAALTLPLYDHTILVEAAGNLDIPPVYMEDLEETSPGSIIFNLSHTSLGGQNSRDKNMPLADKLFYEEKKIIEKAVADGDCIIVGRCAGFLLKERKDCLNVFIHADKGFRLKRAVDIEHISPAEAEAALKKVDKRRSSFYTRYTGLVWGQKENFDICLDSGRLGVEACVDVLVQILR